MKEKKKKDMCEWHRQLLQDAWPCPCPPNLTLLFFIFWVINERTCDAGENDVQNLTKSWQPMFL